MDQQSRLDLTLRVVEAFGGKAPEDHWDSPAVDAYCRLVRQRLEILGATQDYLSVVLRSPMIRDGEEPLRVLLAKIPHLVAAHVWEPTVTASEEGFERAARGESATIQGALRLLRATRRPWPATRTEHGRWGMLHGQWGPTSYESPQHQQMFEALVSSAREVLSGGMGQLPSAYGVAKGD